MSDRPPNRASGDAERRAYYDEAATWAADVHGSLRASRRTAWTVAGVAAAVAALEALALVLLTPLKTVVPYTILVDRQTGYAETVRGLQPGRLTQDAAVTQALLAQYVQARETFDATDLTGAYRKVLLWSGGDARADYQRTMQRSNPTSPLNLNTPTTVVATTVKSVSLLTPGTALVRFDTLKRDGAAILGEQRSWSAVMAFRYSDAPMSMADRFLNPLGFQVTRYRRDAESVAPSVVSAGAPTPTVVRP